MIQSRPQTGNWQYCFFIDYEGHADSGASKQALEDLQACCQSFRVLGSYPRATLNAK
jgi:chorismate mutase/prephenate dehydratase